MKKSRLRTVLVAAIAAALFTACPKADGPEVNPPGPINPGGGEQGLEVGTMDLEKDRDAANEALNGWWKDSQAGLKERMSWYDEIRFGCFVHWGPYSTLGGVYGGTNYGGYAEHIMRMAGIPVATYKNEVVKNFDPAGFDAEEWMDQVVKTGMKYFIVTAKHHDGFAMWPSDAYKPKENYPSFDASCPTYDMRMTKLDKNRDLMMELRDAARKRGIKFGFYYSHAFDWENPYAPGNDWDDFRSINGFTAGLNPGGDGGYGGSNWWIHDKYKDFDQVADYYVKSKSKPQIQELVEKYDPDVMWFDTPHKLPLYQNIDICKFLRGLKTNVIINGRLARWGDTKLGDRNLGDYTNSGDRAAFFFPLKDDYWESIPTTNNSYGYNSIDNSHKTSTFFIQLLASAASKGGNILMNVGPMGSGKWDPKDVNIFNGIGAWMAVNGESIYGTTRTNDIPIPNWGVITRKGNYLYLHVFRWPSSGELWLGSLEANISDAAILATKEKVTWSQEGKDIKITVPTTRPDASNSVIRLTLIGNYTAHPQRLLEPRNVNSLMAFDAVLTGKFSKGDGKVNYNYLSDWKTDEQYLTWNVKLHEQKAFRFSLMYTGSGTAGEITVEIDGTGYDLKYAASGTRLFVDLPSAIPLDAGDHVISLKGKTKGGEEYLRPMELTLIP